MKILIKFILLFFSLQLCAQDFEWALQITDPEFDLKHIPLDEKEARPLLPKTSWRCSVGEIQKKGNSESRELNCDYSIEKAGTFTTYTVCSPDRGYDESKVVIFDERKNLSFTLLLLCRKKDSPTKS
ncbi:MAG: hypothetical protein Fur0010_19330 [Bdellovibrio sp.]